MEVEDDEEGDGCVVQKDELSHNCINHLWWHANIIRA